MGTFIFFVAGCPGEMSQETAPIDPTYSSLYDNVFKGCSQGGNCHGVGVVPEGGPDFSGDKNSFYQNVVSIKASNYDWDVAPGCEEVFLIEPGKPSSSLIAGTIIASVQSDFTPGCTPNYTGHSLISDPLSPAQSEALKTWIKGGASP